jgi:phospholipid-binding lipoprotein MlaA
MSIAAIALAIALAAPATAPLAEQAGAAAVTAEAPTPVPDQPRTGSQTDARPAGQPETPRIEPEVPAASDDIVVTAREQVPGDPLAVLNAKSFEAVQAVDKVFVGPVATGYRKGLPRPVRMGLRNFLRNLEEPVIALNYVLQLKPGRAAKSVGRFAVNSTVGVAGLVDVAKNKPFNLPYTPNGIANTLACYGVGPGPFFFLPLIGPTTLRDMIGVTIDRAIVPAAIGNPFDKPYYVIPAGVIDSLNDRVEIDQQINRIRAESADPYVATRALYLAQRKSEIAAICPGKGDKVDAALPPRPGMGRD